MLHAACMLLSRISHGLGTGTGAQYTAPMCRPEAVLTPALGPKHDGPALHTCSALKTASQLYLLLVALLSCGCRVSQRALSYLWDKGHLTRALHLHHALGMSCCAEYGQNQALLYQTCHLPHSCYVVPFKG